MSGRLCRGVIAIVDDMVDGGSGWKRDCELYGWKNAQKIIYPIICLL
ncbi:hypothetical protein [Mastigocoleus testarum]|nr:hypothetical protein [Mastigocoleus testarum]